MLSVVKPTSRNIRRKNGSNRMVSQELLLICELGTTIHSGTAWIIKVWEESTCHRCSNMSSETTNGWILATVVSLY
jgi:hypothetical protein